MLYTLFLFCGMPLTKVSIMAKVFVMRYSRYANIGLALGPSWNLQFSFSQAGPHAGSSQ